MGGGAAVLRPGASGSKLLIFSPPPKTVFRFLARNYEQPSRRPSGAEHKRFFVTVAGEYRAFFHGSRPNVGQNLSSAISRPLAKVDLAFSSLFVFFAKMTHNNPPLKALYREYVCFIGRFGPLKQAHPSSRWL